MDQQKIIKPYSCQRTITVPGNRFESTCSVDIWKKFQPEVTLPYLNLRRAKMLLSATRSFPPNCEIFFSNIESDKWVVYFCFAPDGLPRANHNFTIKKLRAEGYSILIVCATPALEQAQNFVKLTPDALIWKALRGYDFSGYTLGLNALVSRYNSVDVLVLNDSILGPFNLIRPMLESSPWDLTGFMTSYSVEHHIQSFAFYIKDYCEKNAKIYRQILFKYISFNSQGPVSLLQETRLGSALQKSISIGSILSPSIDYKMNYYLLGNPKGLLDIGFPFIKESIFRKFVANYDQDFYNGCLMGRDV